MDVTLAFIGLLLFLGWKLWLEHSVDVGRGKRYRNVREMQADLWRWHDEAQAAKLEVEAVGAELGDVRHALLVVCPRQINDIRCWCVDPAVNWVEDGSTHEVRCHQARAAALRSEG